MKIVLTGGGSGGHITPILAVADELKKQNPTVQLVYIGQSGDKFADIPSNHEQIDEVYLVKAGKFRRYLGEGWRHFFDLKTIWLNFRDFFRFLFGTWQSYSLLKKIKPAAIFTPGGFVGVPVGLAAALKKIPFITHDLDATPGLANRINARWAVAHAVAFPAEYYKYPKESTHYVGVPVSDEYKKVTPALKTQYRRGLKISNDAKVVCVTGGGLGADRLNRAVVDISAALFGQYPNLFLIHIAGRDHDKEIHNLYEKQLNSSALKRLIVKGFVNDLYRYSASADVIVTRAGATTLAEFAMQHLPCIVVPNPILSGGHQTKNAQHLAEQGAIELISENEIKKNPANLLAPIKKLLDYSDKRTNLGDKLGALAKADAAAKLANLILKNAKGHGVV